MTSMLRRLAISACRSAAPALGAVAKPSAGAWGALAGAGVGSNGLSTLRGCAVGAREAAAGAWETGTFARRGLSGRSVTPVDAAAGSGGGGEEAEAAVVPARMPVGFARSGMKAEDVQYYVPGWGDSRKKSNRKKLMKQKAAFIKVRTRPRHAASPSIPRVRIHLPG